MKLTLVVLALRRDMRSPELLSESLLAACLRLITGFVFVTRALASPSESNEGTFLAAVVDAGLDLEKASKTDG